MNVQVINDSGEVVWGRGMDENGTPCGLTSRSYVTDGTLAQVLMALGSAISQAGAEMLPADDLDGVLYRGASTVQINGDVPVA
ncbi:hypothetical protein [Chromobacterium violaceum]|uniref:hypothetical protein n=1 Tax=Chromobacterium violaceum TaxID=536 RepID=UPI00194ED21D|nr:hypothetical protein [Chromobacterium violaceum]QRO35446.1 hypothetical protein I6K04_05205 [Chromobacterium violaceum]QRQ19346.1 hypothetical protein I6K03_17525 [Chromobacterium violaceum]